MIVLDTNLLSEVIRPAPEPAALRWLAAQPAVSMFISAVTEAELRYGVEVLPAGKRRDALAAQIAGMIEVDFLGRILPFDSAAAIAYAEIAAGRPEIILERCQALRSMLGLDDIPSKE